MQMSGIFVLNCSKIYLKVAHGEYFQFYSHQFSSFLALKPKRSLYLYFFQKYLLSCTKNTIPNICLKLLKGEA